LAVPALAEGTWQSYIDGFRVGDKSRTWSKQVNDGWSTNITFVDCKVHGYSTATVRIQLTRETPWYQPDENMGRQNYSCSGSGTIHRVWDQPPHNNDYHFVATHLAGSSSSSNQYSTCLSVGCVKVSY
jgi:hypothetical protein